MNEFIFIIILITLPLLLLGIINKTKAFMAGKQGAPIIQLYYDFFKLLRKSQVISRTTSIIFKYAPAISLSCLIFSALLMPIMGSKSILNFQGNFILFC